QIYGKSIQPEKIISASAFILILNKGQVYISGEFYVLQTENGVVKFSPISYSEITPLLHDTHIRDIAAGDNFILLLAENGDMYGYGNLNVIGLEAAAVPILIRHLTVSNAE